jgi:hypothetical protein
VTAATGSMLSQAPAHGTPAASPRTPLPRHAHRRGSRAFGALVIGLAGFVVLGVVSVVLPSLALDRVVMAWVTLLAIPFGVGHFIAAYGLIRRRTWGANLTGYLAATGLGIAAYGLLVTMTGLDPFGASSSLPSDQARAEGIGLLVWMGGLWIVAARFASRSVRAS